MSTEQFELIGNQIVTAYYQQFDSGADGRAQVVNLYHPQACVTFEEHKAMGHDQIRNILTQKLTFQRIQHLVTKVDCQPVSGDGVSILVTGRLKTDDDPPHAYSQTFIIKHENGSFFITNDIFRLSIHDTM
jgi:hypothetical protein